MMELICPAGTPAALKSAIDAAAYQRGAPVIWATPGTC